MTGKSKAKAVRDNNRARQFADVLMDYVRIGEGKFEVEDDGAVRFPARVGERELDVHCWFNAETSAACISIYYLNACPPALVPEVAEFVKPIIAVQSSVGGRLSLSKTGHVKWMGSCRLSPTDPIDMALARDLVATGISESNRLFDVVAAFVGGHRSARSNDTTTDLRLFTNRQSPKDEPLN